MIDIGRRTLAKLGLIVAAGAMAPAKLRAATRAAATGLQVAGLRVEGLVNPVGLDVAKPHLSWQLISSRRNVRQSAYRLVVGSSAAEVAAGRGDLWDTGRVASDQSLDIVYEGRPLPSRQRCWWTVQVWDEAGRSAPLPAPSSWEMGLLSATDWTASWLAVESPEEREDREAGMPWIWGPTPKVPGGRYFRLSVDFKAPVRDAVLIMGARDRLAGVYVDGQPLAVPTPQERWGLEPLTRLELGPLAAGRHVLGAEVAVMAPDMLVLRAPALSRRSCGCATKMAASRGSPPAGPGGRVWRQRPIGPHRPITIRRGQRPSLHRSLRMSAGRRARPGIYGPSSGSIVPSWPPVSTPRRSALMTCSSTATRSETRCWRRNARISASACATGSMT